MLTKAFTLIWYPKLIGVLQFFLRSLAGVSAQNHFTGQRFIVLCKNVSPNPQTLKINPSWDTMLKDFRQNNPISLKYWHIWAIFYSYKAIKMWFEVIRELPVSHFNLFLRLRAFRGTKMYKNQYRPAASRKCMKFYFSAIPQRVPLFNWGPK